MRIIDNKKDYYDYLSGIYGEDPLAVYDRRGSVTWPQYKGRFTVFHAETRFKQDSYIPPKYVSWRSSENQYFLCLEAGLKQFVIIVRRFLEKPSSRAVTIERSILGVREVEKKHARSPLALFECEYSALLWRDDKPFDPRSVRYWSKRSGYFHHGLTDEPMVENPILKDSFLVQMISADKIWQALYEYIMSLNDKEIIDDRPDTMKIQSAGFDLKTSFRNVKDKK